MVADFELDVPGGSVLVTAPRGYRLVDAEWRRDRVMARLVVDAAEPRCTICGSSALRRYGRGDVGLVDAPAAGVRAAVVVARQRFKCASCERMSREELPNVPDGHRITDRCLSWIRSQLPLQSSGAIAETIGAKGTAVTALARELGLSRRRGPSTDLPMPVARCFNCKRLVELGPDAAPHLGVGVADAPVANGILLCTACYADVDAHWIRRTG